MMLWLWTFWMMAFAAPTMVWEIKSATPSSWKNNKTKGYIVLPLVNEYCEVGPTPLYWEVSSQNGKEHSMSIECSVSGDRIYTSDFTVEASGTVSMSAVVPLQDSNDYSSITCNILDEKRTQVQSTQVTLQVQQISSVSKMIFLDTERTQQTHPEWMIATTQHRQEEMSIHVNETKWLPQQFMGYLGVKTVVWFESERPLENAQEIALLEWVQQGGHVVVVNSPAFQQKSIWSSWLEPRFSFQELNKALVHPTYTTEIWSDVTFGWSSKRTQYEEVATIRRQGNSSVKAYSVGRGRVSIVEQRMSVEEAFLLLEDPHANQTGFYSTFEEDTIYGGDIAKSQNQHPFFNGLRLSNMIDTLQLFSLVPSWVLKVVLLCFVILIGPLNMFWKGSRLNWVWRTPLIALLCTIIVLCLNGYLNSDGRGLSTEFAIWDARSNDLFLRKERLYFVSNSSLETQTVQSHSQHLPMNPDSSQYGTLYNKNGVQRWTNFAKLRDVQALLSWHHVSQRRGIRVENEIVYNDLDKPVFNVLYRDNDGMYWRAQSVLEGNSETLIEDSEFTTLDLGRWMHEDWRSQNARTLSWKNLPKHTVFFEIKDAVVWDAVEASDGKFDEVDGVTSSVYTLVYGVLP